MIILILFVSEAMEDGDEVFRDDSNSSYPKRGAGSSRSRWYDVGVDDDDDDNGVVVVVVVVVRGGEISIKVESRAVLEWVVWWV
jgi:hypothetical protein